MRVLLIAYNYPPDAASGAQRVSNVASTLVAAGIEVRVVAARTERARPAEPGLTVDRVRALPDGGHVARLLAQLNPRPRNAGTDERTGAEPIEMDGTDHTIRRWLLSIFQSLGGDAGFVPSAVHSALRSDRLPPDVIYTSAPPVSSHLAGLLVHAVTGAPWIAEFRDPWLVGGVPYRSAALRSMPMDALERFLYHRCLAAATKLVAVTDGIRDELAEDFDPRGIHVLRNGIPALLRAPAARRDGPLRILHLGSLYASRDPAPFFEAVAGLRRESSCVSDGLEICFVGPPPEPSLVRKVDDLGLADIVRFLGWVDHSEGQRLVEEADLLLLLAQQQPLQVPNKLYEYLGSRKPILAFADAAGETAHLFRGAEAGVLVTERDAEADVRAAVKRAFVLAESSPRKVRPEVEARLERWTTDAQLAALPDILRDAAGR